MTQVLCDCTISRRRADLRYEKKRGGRAARVTLRSRFQEEEALTFCLLVPMLPRLLLHRSRCVNERQTMSSIGTAARQLNRERRMSEREKEVARVVYKNLIACQKPAHSSPSTRPRHLQNAESRKYLNQVYTHVTFTAAASAVKAIRTD